jgi:hypothetical protein
MSSKPAALPESSVTQPLAQTGLAPIENGSLRRVALSHFIVDSGWNQQRVGSC